MLGRILIKLGQYLVTLTVVALVLLAVYVSIGRQFMPDIAGYKPYLERQIFDATGVPVSIGSLSGSFQGFNPVIKIYGLEIIVPGADVNSAVDQPNALVLEEASIIVDIRNSIWQRRWVLENFLINAIELDIEQTATGLWQMSGVNFIGGGNADLHSAYQTILRVSRINLTNLAINLHTSSGNVVRVQNGIATIQNLGNDHYLHINANMENSSEQLVFSVEIQGNELAAATGLIHFKLPEADYSLLVGGQKIGNVELDALHGGGSFWLDLNQGSLENLVAQTELENISFTLAGNESVTLENISGEFRIARGGAAGDWEIAVSDYALQWEGHRWEPFNAYFYLVPEQSLLARVDNLDIAFIAEFGAESGLFTGSLGEQFEAFSPKGLLEHLNLYIPFSDAGEEPLSMAANVVGAEVAASGAVPAMWGINAYVEMGYDFRSEELSGLVEVESDEFSIKLPNLFADRWDYSYVNGNIGIHLSNENGQELKLVSSVIVAESDAVDGRAQFSIVSGTDEQGENKSELVLLVGGQRVDAQQKALYLPLAPNVDPGLRNTMQWLDGAVLNGTVFNSGVIYRGSTLQDSTPEDKTFQSYYYLRDGEINFSDAWPILEALNAVVLTDNSNVDIEVLTGGSEDIDLSGVTADIRRNGQDESWLTVVGNASGLTAQGLSYLQSTPVSESLRSTFRNWEATGGFSAVVDIHVPLNRPKYVTDVTLNIMLDENELFIPAYQLQFVDVNGPVIFSTRTGLQDSRVFAKLFEEDVELNLASQMLDGKLDIISVDASGSVSPEELIGWPMQTDFVRGMLSQLDGSITYTANLNLQQNITDESNHLLIKTDLVGGSLNLPEPFAKTAANSYPLAIDLSFGVGAKNVSGTFGPQLLFDFVLGEQGVDNGIVFLGDNSVDLENLMAADTEGIAILGELEQFEFEDWYNLLDRLNSTSSSSGGFNEQIAFADLAIGTLEMYQQKLGEVDVHLDGDATKRSWLVALTGEGINGNLSVPWDSDEYLQIDLDYIRLPGSEEELDELTQGALETDIAEFEEEEEIDVLAAVDPRALPRMKMDTDDFSIGENSFGSWKFTLDPFDNGAALSDLIVDFRGLRVGLDDYRVDEEGVRLIPHLSWLYDGSEHHSELTGQLTVGNLADFLVLNGYAASLESDNAWFNASVDWPGSPAFFAAENLSGDINLVVEEGRFLQGGGATGALKLISIINFDAIMQRLRFSDDMLRSGLAYDEILGTVHIEEGLIDIEDQMVISGPSSLYQISGEIDLEEETINGEMYLTLPVSDNIPWFGLLSANLPLAVGAYLFDRIFGDQVDSLTSAVYTLEGPWEGLEPRFKQAFGAPSEVDQVEAVPQ